MITLDPPYRLTGLSKLFIGWCTVKSEAQPFVRITINNVPVSPTLLARPDVKAVYPEEKVIGLRLEVNFQDLFAKAEARWEPNAVLVVVHVDTGIEARTFEYEVTQDWVDAVVGSTGVKARPKPVPPEDLQIRVTGAAAGGFYLSGEKVARQISAILGAAGHDLRAFRDILDFGCGPGRVISAIHGRVREARLAGSDIDSEAIAWCQQHLTNLGQFVVNQADPPTVFPDDSFDLIYAISILTHLSETMQFSWLSEWRRLLKPQGVLITTILNPYAYDLPPHVLAAARERGHAFFEDAAITNGLPTFYRLAYMTDDYVQKEWSRYFEVLRIGKHDLNDTQDSVVCMRSA